MKEKYKSIHKDLRTIIELIVVLFIVYLCIAIFAHPWKLKNTENSNTFTAGVIFKQKILKDKYELLEYGNSIWCLGTYEIYKLKNNESSNIFDKQIEVCK
jgi:hypothetical protein